MKYLRPEITVVKIETQPIASSGLDNWLSGSEYEDAKDYITNYLVNS